LSVLFFGLALWLMRRGLQGFRYPDVVHFLDALPPVRLFEAFALTGLGYLALTRYDMLSLRYNGIRLPHPHVAFASLTCCSFSNTLGYPLFTGTPLRVRLYSGWGLSALDVTRVVTFSFLTFWLGVLTLAGVTFVAEPAAVEQVLHLQVWAARALGGAFLGLLAGYVVFNGRRTRPLALRGVELVLPGTELALGQIVVASFDWALAGAALYALVPDSWGIDFPSFLAIFLLAQVAGLVSQVPG